MSSNIFTTENQEPLVPAEVSFPSFTFLPLDIKAVTDGDLSFLSGEGFKAALMLMAQSWRETPAASLPDDDRRLAAFAGLGRGSAADAAWATVKDEALSDFALCSDGRWYSRTLAPHALEAWKGVAKRKAQTEAARQARASNRPPHTSATSSVPETVSTSVTASKGDNRIGENIRGQERGSEGRSSTMKGGGDVKGGVGGSSPAREPFRVYEEFQGENINVRQAVVNSYARDYPELAADIHDHLRAIDRELWSVPEKDRSMKIRPKLKERNEAALREGDTIPF